MGRIDNLCAIEKIPGYEGTRLNVNDSMMGIGTIIAVPRGRYDTVSTTWFNSVPYSHGTIFPIPVNRDSGNLLTHTPTRNRDLLGFSPDEAATLEKLRYVYDVVYSCYT